MELLVLVAKILRVHNLERTGLHRYLPQLVRQVEVEEQLEMVVMDYLEHLEAEVLDARTMAITTPSLHLEVLVRLDKEPTVWGRYLEHILAAAEVVQGHLQRQPRQPQVEQVPLHRLLEHLLHMQAVVAVVEQMMQHTGGLRMVRQVE